MTTVLDSIVAGVRADLATRMEQVPRKTVEIAAAERSPALPAADLMAARPFSVIAEVKRASPSKGDLAPITDPADLATRYESGGAAAISVLTEQRRFAGSLTDLDAVRAAVSTPILRKDFMVDEYQVLEARAHGADVILLIVASLADSRLAALDAVAREVGMSVLVEVHDEHELERALALSPRLVGVNARNLKTLEVDLATCDRLLPQVPAGIIAVAESGLATVSDVERMARAGADAVLVGEALVTGGDPSETVATWTRAGATVIAQSETTRGRS